LSGRIEAGYFSEAKGISKSLVVNIAGSVAERCLLEGDFNMLQRIYSETE
jgi:hypothetical protein